MIVATNTATQRTLIPAGNYPARCYSMIHIGTVTENIQGTDKQLNKCRIGWELPTELRVFKEENGEQPCIISKEFTLSMHEKSNLRKVLASWRGKDFSENEAKAFDITVLIGVPCLINIIHKPSKDGQKIFEEIGSVSPLPKGFECPAAINKPVLLQYDDFNFQLFDTLPDFIKTKIQSSVEWQKMTAPEETHVQGSEVHPDFKVVEGEDDLPF